MEAVLRPAVRGYAHKTMDEHFASEKHTKYKPMDEKDQDEHH